MGHFGQLVRFVRRNMQGGGIGVEFIALYRFPDAVREKFARAHPELAADALAQVFEGLKSYFAVCAVAPGAIAGMPSCIVEEAWHTFMQFTRDYAAFCERAFGRSLHAPDNGGDSETARAALGQTWRVACAREHIDARQASRLPLLFAIDRRLNVPGGRFYALNDTDAEAARRLLGATSFIYLAAAMAGAGHDADGIFLPPHGEAAPDAIGDIGGGGSDFGDLSGGGDFGGSA